MKRLRMLTVIFRGLLSIKYTISFLLLPIFLAVYEVGFATARNLIFGRGDIMLNILAPISNNPVSSINIVMIILPLLFSMLMFGSYFVYELKYRSRYSLPRYGNIYTWYLLIVTSIILFTVVYSVYYYSVIKVVLVISGTVDGLFQNQYKIDVLSDFNVGWLIAIGFFVRLLVVLTMQISLLFTGNKSLSFIVPIVLLLFSMYIDIDSFFIPFRYSFTIRNLQNNISNLEIILNFVFVFVLSQVFAIVQLNRRSFILQNIDLR